MKAAVRKAVRSVQFQWPDVIEADDLEQELFMWVIQSPSVQAKLESGDAKSRHGLLVRQGHRIASEARKRNLRFAAEFEYSIDDVKAILSGKDRRHEALDDLTEAMNSLRETTPQYAEIIARKYAGEELTGRADTNRLYRAHIALTDEMNSIVRQKFDAYTDGPGSRTVVSNAAAMAALD